MSANDPLFAPVQFLKGVGPRRAALLEKLSLRTVYDLLTHYPARYYDRRTLTPLARVRSGEVVTVQGKVTSVRSRRSLRKRISILEVAIRDESGRGALVWFNQPFREKEFQPGDVVLACGKAQGRDGSIAVDEHEILDEEQEPRHAGGLVPSYRTTEGLGKRLIRALVRGALEQAASRAPELIPEAARKARGWPTIQEALKGVHAPETPREAEEARRRLAYEEFFVLQVRLALRRRATASEKAGVRLPVSETLDFRIRALFPFALTAAQDRVIAQIRRDLAGERPMNRLLQGDVGSGKTVVAAYALLAAAGRRAQGALMAPTEILAEQHARTFRRLLEHSRLRIGFLSGGMKEGERKDLLARVAAGEVDLVIGTHAVIEKQVVFRKLAVAVVDEQHKFGVLQRAALGEKGARPHILVMSATPIPRTLALTVYGDLDVSVLNEKPPGRREVRTMYVPPAGRREKMVFIREKLLEGRQAYFVYPLIDDSDKIALASAVRMHERLREEFRDFRVALLHGRMKPMEKDAAMEEFRSGRAHVLVSTLVIEVGVDVPNAGVMVIDNCERYGLAQLHQLRGRIGRGSYESFCLLFGRKNERIDVLVSTHDGFKIAEADLRLRGSGDLGGTRQAGLPEFKAANLLTDLPLLEQAREDAFALVRRDPGLASVPALREVLLGRRSSAGSLLHVG